MLKIQLLISVFVLYNLENINCKKIYKTCSDDNDCITISSCPEAQRLNEYRKENKTINAKFISSICGMTRVGKRPAVQVCCSNFEETKDETTEVFDEPTPSLRGRIAVDPFQRIEESDLSKHDSATLLPRDCGIYYEDRIAGGDAANMYEFPWMALIGHVEIGNDGRREINYGCGGTIINSRYILTAAHCVANKIIQHVRLGEYDIYATADCQGEYPRYHCETHLQTVSVERKIFHKNYQMSPVTKNDIALLRVADEIDFKFQNVRPVCLPLYKGLIESKLSGKLVTVVGWGITEHGTASARPLKVSMPVLSDSRCEEAARKKVICAGGSGKDACRGDSGGPLMFIDEYGTNYRMIQYGIVSRGPEKCATSPNPGIYTDVRKYMRWVLDNIEE